jgi:hypothetical protein
MVERPSHMRGFSDLSKAGVNEEVAFLLGGFLAIGDGGGTSVKDRTFQHGHRTMNVGNMKEENIKDWIRQKVSRKSSYKQMKGYGDFTHLWSEGSTSKFLGNYVEKEFERLMTPVSVSKVCNNPFIAAKVANNSEGKTYDYNKSFPKLVELGNKIYTEFK